MAALTVVQGTPKENAAAPAVSVACVFASPPTVGHGIVVCANEWRNTGLALPNACTDNFGNTYTRVIAQTSTAQATTTIFFCSAITATGASFTVTPSSTVAGDWSAKAIECSAGIVVDQFTGSFGTVPTQPNTGSTAALTGVDVLQVACHAILNSQSAIAVVSATPTWTQEFEELPSSFIAGEADTRSVSAATGTTPSCSWTDTVGVWAAVIVVFTTPSGGPVMAIARDGAPALPAGGEGLTTYSFAKTVSGPNPILFVTCVGALTTDLITGVTFNGVSMTLVDKQLNTADRYHYLFMLKAPSVGTFNVVLSASSPSSIYPMAMSYTGALQTGTFDAKAKSTASTITLTLPITVVAANSWVFAGLRTANNSASPGTGSSSLGAGGEDLNGVDSGGPVAAGAYSMAITSGATTGLGLIAASFQPAAGGTSTRGGTGSMMGI